MLSYQLLNYYEFIEKELEILGETLVPIFDWVEKYKEFISKTNTQILKSSVSTSGNNKIYTVANARIKENYADIVKEFKSKFSSYIVFDTVGKFKQKITEYKKQNSIEAEDAISLLIKETDDLFAAYDEFQKDDTEQTKFINFANKLVEYKVLYKNSKIKNSDFIKLTTDIGNLEINKEEKLKIQLLDVEYSLKEFSDNLQYIDEAYNEIGNLIYADTSSVSYRKLQILKIESGSLFSEIFGDKTIIEIFTKILRKAIQWVYGKDEKDIELERHTKLAKALKDDAEIMQMLSEQGCDIEDSKQILSKALNIISKDMLNLAKSSYNIKVNDEQFKIEDYKYGKFLTNASMKKLNSKSETEENLDE